MIPVFNWIACRTSPSVDSGSLNISGLKIRDQVIEFFFIWKLIHKIVKYVSNISRRDKSQRSQWAHIDLNFKIFIPILQPQGSYLSKDRLPQMEKTARYASTRKIFPEAGSTLCAASSKSSKMQPGLEFWRRSFTILNIQEYVVPCLSGNRKYKKGG